MKKVKCKTCGNIIYHEYTPLTGKCEKSLSDLRQSPTDDCNISIYLECENNHINKYYCKIKIKQLKCLKKVIG